MIAEGKLIIFMGELVRAPLMEDDLKILIVTYKLKKQAQLVFLF
jgi:hypothetical protein